MNSDFEDQKEKHEECKEDLQKSLDKINSLEDCQKQLEHANNTIRQQPNKERAAGSARNGIERVVYQLVTMFAPRILLVLVLLECFFFFKVYFIIPPLSILCRPPLNTQFFGRHPLKVVTRQKTTSCVSEVHPNFQTPRHPCDTHFFQPPPETCTRHPNCHLS